MTPERWHRIETLFELALERPPSERDAFLDAACPDSDLRAELRSLLAAHEHPGPVDRLAAELAAPLAALTPPEPTAPMEGAAPPAEGRRVGPYRLMRLLGRGGMGAVYLADRADGQFEQRVALKLVREGFDTPPLRAYFLHERQTLARLQHPGIARLLDGGLTDDGLPYFAMEYVDGQPITAYCDAHRLDLRQRLRLFGEVCEAVHHAHQHLVVHRDLKPSNILVTEHGAPRVKLLDFGIAKLVEETGGDGAPPTRGTLHVMTPEYAAPEQIRGEAITTATDVYNLGVVLYELLTGLRPYTVRDRTPSEMERLICETTPPRPSAVVTHAHTGGELDPTALETPDAIGHARATEPEVLARRLAGDLDTIVLKALAKEPERRYPSAEALHEDIERHLAGLPVRARPATPGYRLRSFVRRHRTAVAAGVLVVLSLVGGLAGMTWQASRAAAERDRARAEATKAEEALDFLVALFESSDPNEARGDSVTAREVLDRGARRLDALDQPTVRATLLDAVGRVYHSLGLFEQADSLLGEALAMRRRTNDVPPRRLAEALYHLGALRTDQSDYATADALLREALPLLRSDADEATVAAVEHELGEVLSEQGRYDEAEPFLRRALATRRTLHGASHPTVQATQEELFLVLHRRGDFEAAEALYREAVAHSRATPDRVDQATVDHYLGLARMLSRFRRDYSAAEAVLLEIFPRAVDQFGPDHPNIATLHNELAHVFLEQEAYTRAERHARASLAIWQDRLGDEHRETAISKSTLATVRRRQGAVAEAEALQREALATQQRLYGPAHLVVLAARLRLAGLLREQDRLDDAETLTRATLAQTREHLGPDHPHEAWSLQELAAIASARGDATAAVDFHREALALRQRRHAPGHWRIAEAQSLLAGALLDAGRTDEAASLLRESLLVLENELGAQASETKRAAATLDRLRARSSAVTAGR